MRVREMDLAGVFLVEPIVFHDSRGFFIELYNEGEFAHAGLTATFVQDNHSRSVRGVLRGLHYQLENPQGKLVTAVTGEIFDVVADIKVGSPTFGQWTSVTLRADDPTFLWIPPGYAHGFCVLSDVADVIYKCTAPYAAADERGVVWNDATIDVAWPLDQPIISERDMRLPSLADATPWLPRHNRS